MVGGGIKTRLEQIDCHVVERQGEEASLFMMDQSENR